MVRFMPMWDKLLLVAKSPAGIMGVLIGGILAYLAYMNANGQCDPFSIQLQCDAFDATCQSMQRIRQWSYTKCIFGGGTAAFVGAFVGGALFSAVQWMKEN